MKIENLDIDKPKSYKHLNKFLPQPPFRCLISGPSGSGKSTLMANLFKNPDGYSKCFRPQDIFIFSATMGLDKKLDYIHTRESNKYNRFEPEVIQEIMKQQESLIKHYSARKAPQLLFIFEDLASENVFTNHSKLINRLAMSGRHLKISFIVLSQKYTSINTSIRRNVDIVFLFEPSNYYELDQVVSENMDKKRKTRFFNLLLKLYEEPYSFIQITYRSGFNRFVKNLKDVIDF